MRLSFPYFIAKRLSLQKGSGSSQLIISIAMGAVALSIAVMIVAIAIVKGYQSEIRGKIIGFSTHIQVSRLDMNNSFETSPIYRDSLLEKLLLSKNGIVHLQPYSTKPGILKTEEYFTGVVLKGVDATFDWTFFKQHLQKGTIPNLKNKNQSSVDIFISQALANKLKLNIGDAVLLYLAQSPPRVRKFTICGIYNSGLTELDEIYAFVDMRQVQKLNSWNEFAISGYELAVNNYTQLDVVSNQIAEILPYHLQVKTIRDLYPQLFDWLGLLDLNVWVIITLMIIVACINMITVLLILIIERGNMIGLLKAMGAQNKTISSVFIYMASYLVISGMVIGNIIALSVCLSQQYFGWFKLSPDAYYLTQVPIQLEAMDILLINVGSFVICYVVLLLPAAFVSRIKPIKAIKFQ